MEENTLRIVFLISALFVLLSPIMFIQSVNSTFDYYTGMIPEPYRTEVVDTYSGYLNYLYLLFIPGLLSLLYLGIKRKGNRYLAVINVILGLLFLFGLPMLMDYYLEQLLAEYAPLLDLIG